MNIGKDSSFWGLYKAGTIKIPQIQRDYVQGRDNARVITNRSSFAKELVNSLVSNKRITLNFIYGYYEEDCFIPIDGQQRLTTLFLLHFLVFSKADHKNELLYKERLNFSYQTRYTTDRFLKSLSKSDISLLDSNDLRTAISEAPWYAFSWNNDPSVVSMLIMLAELKTAFGTNNDWEGYYNRLTADNCPIRFMLLEMTRNQLGKPNQLYIRMNSRGKQLTDFENFKASLYGYIYECQNPSLQTLMDQIKEKVDGDWQTLVWSIPEKENVAEKYSDTFYRDLIHWIFWNRLSSDNKLNDNKDWIKPKGKNISEVFLENYIDIAENSFESCIQDIWYTMLTITNVNNTDSEVFKRMVGSLLNYGPDKKGNYNCQLAEYKQRVLLFALAKYGRETDGLTFDISLFNDWYRIIANLTENTEIDDPDTYCRVCQAIDSFNGVLSIASNPDEISKLSGFASRQIEEEVFKQKIANISEAWKEAIHIAESDQYFQGEIYFSFLMNNILTPSDAMVVDPNDFLKYWASIVEVKNLAHDNDNLFHRALLTYGDYSVKAPGGVGNAGVTTFFQYSEKHHNYDWRGLLRPVSGALTSSALKFKSFVDDCTGKKPEDVANARITACVLPSPPNLHDEVLFYLIKYSELFEYCQKYYYVWKDNDGPDWNRFLLMKTSKRNTYMEVKSYVFYLLAKVKSKDVSIREGGNPYNPEDRRSYAEYKNNVLEYKKDYFTDESNSYLMGASGEKITSPEELLKKFGL